MSNSVHTNLCRFEAGAASDPSSSSTTIGSSGDADLRSVTEVAVAEAAKEKKRLKRDAEERMRQKRRYEESSSSSFKKRRLISDRAVISADQSAATQPAINGTATEPHLCVSKPVTKSDTNFNQNRFQLTQSEVLQNFPAEIVGLAKEDGVSVRVLDRARTRHEMVFKYLKSSNTFRFIGPGYKQFVMAQDLKEGQTMTVFLLPGYHESREYCFVFLPHRANESIVAVAAVAAIAATIAQKERHDQQGRGVPVTAQTA